MEKLIKHSAKNVPAGLSGAIFVKVNSIGALLATQKARDGTRNVFIFLAALLVEKCVYSPSWRLWVERVCTSKVTETVHFLFLNMIHGAGSVAPKAMAEQWEIFVMKANVKCKAMIYNIKSLEFECMEFGW